MLSAVPPTTCPLLPSAGHASRLMNGELVAVPLVALDVLMRAALIGGGMYLAGARDKVPRYAIGGSLAIETFVLAYLALTKP